MALQGEHHVWLAFPRSLQGGNAGKVVAVGGIQILAVIILLEQGFLEVIRLLARMGTGILGVDVRVMCLVMVAGRPGNTPRLLVLAGIAGLAL